MRVSRFILAALLVAVWLGLNAYLDAEPSETDALQASALDLSDAIAQAHHDAHERKEPQP